MSRRRWSPRSALLLLLTALGVGVAYAGTRPTPWYGRLVFGREGAVSLWVLLDGDRVYVDRTGDPRPCRWEYVGTVWDHVPVRLADAGAATRYRLGGMYSSDFPAPHRPPRLDFSVAINGPVTYRQYGVVKLGDRPERGATAHVHGPLRMEAFGPKANQPKPFTIGGKPYDLRVYAVTATPDDSGWVTVYSHAQDWNSPAFPPGVAPVAEIDFPAESPGQPAVRRRFVLDKFC